jgi:hypothetical protein
MAMTDILSDQVYGDFAPVMSHRQVATKLGIGRARVFYQEKVALEKIRSFLRGNGITSPYDLEEKLLPDVPGDDDKKSVGAAFSPFHGWLPATRIVSLNDGITHPAEVAQAYQLIKESHDALMRPPLLVSDGWGIRNPYRIEAAAFHSGFLYVRAWPVKNAPRTVADLVGLPCTAVVESIFDSDDDGEFDIPLLTCVVVSARTWKP